MLFRSLLALALVGLVVAQPPPPRAGVRMYLHVGYGGTWQEYDVGSHVDNFFGGETSSLILAPGYGVTLYDNPDFTGPSITVTSTTVSFFTLPHPNGHWNDRANSWVVFELNPTTTPQPTTTPPGPTPFNCSLLPGWDPAKPLETAGEPVFSPDESGFVFLNTLEIVWYNPVKFDLQSGTVYAQPPTGYTCSPSPIGGSLTLPDGQVHPSECYNRCVIQEPWDTFMAGPEKFIDTSNPTQSKVRGKLNVNNTENLGPIFRGDPPTIRTIISEFPFEIIFPNTVTGTIGDLETFLPPALAAALILQSVDVDVATLTTDGTARIRTQLQWPFKYLTGPGDYAVNTVNTYGKNIGVSVQLISDCADPGVADDSAADNGNVAPCDQIWEISFTPGPQVCDLDGTYNLDFAATCQPAFIGGGNCPLIGQSGNLEGNLGNILFTLDTENFCAQIIDEVEITADLKSYKNAAFTVPAENYLLGDTIFFEVVVASPKVTLQTVEVSNIRVDYKTGGVVNSVMEFDRTTGNNCGDGSPLGSACNLQNLQINNAGNDRAAFSFSLTDPPFTPPVDGDQDFDVQVLLDVTYVGVNLLGEEEVHNVRLLQTADSAITRAKASGNVVAPPADASSASMVSAAVVAIAGVAALV